jgi:hypothetical protein
MYPVMKTSVVTFQGTSVMSFYATKIMTFDANRCDEPTENLVPWSTIECKLKPMYRTVLAHAMQENFPVSFFSVTLIYLFGTGGSEMVEP